MCAETLSVLESIVKIHNFNRKIKLNTAFAYSQQRCLQSCLPLHGGSLQIWSRDVTIIGSECIFDYWAQALGHLRDSAPHVTVSLLLVVVLLPSFCQLADQEL